MQTSLTPSFRASELGQQADKILRNCVHCGFCNATCPTYQLTGDELDGPRGRIYLIKQILEGNAPSQQTQLHLDRCLTCRNCETTCPSGVVYSRLLDTGRHLTEQSVSRSLPQQLFRNLLRTFFLSPIFALCLSFARSIRPLLPAKLKRAIPKRNPIPDIEVTQHTDKILLVSGCVQKSLQPAIDVAAIKLFNQLGLQTVNATSSSCCGALNHHLGAEPAALAQIKTNIDNWLPLLQDNDVKALTMTASGCGVMIRDYQYLLQNDAVYADKARQISAAYLDPIEIVNRFSNQTPTGTANKRIAFHPPCTLQHGQKITGQVEALLRNMGYELVNFTDTHLCCGSAGTYSITQKKLSLQLRQNKLKAIESQQPEIIVTANIGCQTHLQSGTDIPVRHWLELLVGKL